MCAFYSSIFFTCFILFCKLQLTPYLYIFCYIMLAEYVRSWPITAMESKVKSGSEMNYM